MNKTTLIVTAVGAAIIGAATMHAMPSMTGNEYTFLRDGVIVWRASTTTGRIDRCNMTCEQLPMKP